MLDVGRSFVRRRERGQALVEYAIVFPLQLMMTLAIIQLAQILVAKQVLEYAAFCGARAKLVNLSDDEARKAAVIPLSWICPADAVKDMATGIQLPGWGSQTMSAQLYNQLLAGFPAGPAGDAQRAQLIQFYNTPHAQYLSGCGTASDSLFTPFNQVETRPALPGVCWMLKFNYQLRVPVGNVIAHKIGQLFLMGTNDPNLQNCLITINNQPCLVMTASCVLPNPS